jgi:2-haloacid dehalogenase
MAIRVVACDIFGTTVDWYTGVSEQVATLLPDVDPAELARRWREKYIPSMTRVRQGDREWTYLDTLHRESLDTLLAEMDVLADEQTRAALVRAWHRLPAWPDAVAGLREIGRSHTTAALSNGGFALITSLVKHARLPFDCILSAELARTYKPAAKVYRMTAELLDVAPEEVLLAAAHSWDLDGAKAAGLKTAFIHRPREKGPEQEPDTATKDDYDYHAEDFNDLANQLKNP